jgi:cytochrome b pre-mRNA-processing protein 3
MLTWLFNWSPDRRKASDLYGAVVALARTPALYADMGVADTPEGRYEALVLNLFLVMERLRAEGEAGAEVSQALVETFVIDMDDNMREMGVGDMSVPKKVKKAAAAFYDRADVYRQAMVQPGDDALAEALAKLVPSAEDRTLDAAALAAHLRAVAKVLGARGADDVMAGRFQLS